MSPARKRQVVEHLGKVFPKVSLAKRCRVCDLPISTWKHQPQRPLLDAPLTRRLLELAREQPRWGYRMMTGKLNLEGWRVNRKRIHRLWRQAGLKVKRRIRRKRATGCSSNGVAIQRAERKNHVWTWDFIQDVDESGHPLRWLSIEDEFTRESLFSEVRRSWTAKAVQEILADLIKAGGAPSHIRSDNGPEFVALAIRSFLWKTQVATLYIDPGSPWQNGCVEGYHGRMRDEFLEQNYFANLADAQAKTTAFRHHYNHERPHSSLKYLPPAVFAGNLGAGPGHESTRADKPRRGFIASGPSRMKGGRRDRRPPIRSWHVTDAPVASQQSRILPSRMTSLQSPHSPL